MNTVKLIFAAAAIVAAVAAPAAAASRPHVTPPAAASVSGGHVPVINDCIHVAFPACSEGSF